jgi:uncharacterized protein YqhQ
LPILESGEETLVGGQAVMEGVMMRSPHSYCVAVRKANGEIVTEEAELARLSEKHRVFGWPVLRGLGTLGQAMWLGMKALRFSANAMLQGLDPESSSEKAPKEMNGWAMWGNILFSAAFFIFLYKFVPLYLATWVGHHIAAANSRLAINLIDGGIRILLFLGFAQRFVTWHPRCGTSFLLVVMVIAMLVYALLPIDSFLLKFAARIVLLPFIVGISYELIRFAAKRRRGLMAMLTQPGLWLQRITTQPPSNDQAEVAIYALDRAMTLEKAQGGELVIA